MPSITRDRTCYHKVATTSTGQSLEEIFLQIMKATPKPFDRLQNGEADTRFAANSYVEEQTLHCATLVRYTAGQHLLAVELDPNADSLPIEQVPAAEPSAAKKKEFVDGLCFFAVHGNHFLIIQSKLAGLSQVLEHFEWLARTHLQIKDFTLTFSNYETPANQARPVTEIKSLALVSSLEGEPVPTVQPVAPDGSAEKTRKLKKSETTFATSGKTWDGVRAIFEAFGAPVPPEVRFLGELSESDIQLRVELSWRRRKENDRAKILETLARALDTSETTDYEMTFIDDTKRRGRELRLQSDLPVIITNGIPQPASAYAQMAKWLQGLIASGKVMANP